MLVHKVERSPFSCVRYRRHFYDYDYDSHAETASALSFWGSVDISFLILVPELGASDGHENSYSSNLITLAREQLRRGDQSSAWQKREKPRWKISNTRAEEWEKGGIAVG